MSRPTHPKRPSLGQLPLPTTIVTASPTASSSNYQSPNSPTSSSPRQSSFTIPITANNIQLHNSQYSASNYASSYAQGGSISSPTRSTHAGGIQPSASFFKPMRPGAAPPQQMGRLSMPLEESEDEDEELPVQRLTRPPQVGLSVSHSSSLSAHQHHHSNHSSEMVKAHEDNAAPRDPLSVTHKVSNDPLLPLTGGGVTIITSPSPTKRISIDASANLGILNSTTKPRLGPFDSFRRSVDSAGSKRFSFSRDPRERSVSEGEDDVRRGDIPLTAPKRRSKLWRTSSSSSLRSGLSSAAGHFVDRMNVAGDDAFHVRRTDGFRGIEEMEDEAEERDSSSTHTSSFHPSPPALKKGQYPLSKTPLTYPIDPSLLPERRLEKMQRSIANGRTKQGSEGTLALPTVAPKRGFLTFLIPGSPTSPTTEKPNPLSRAPREGAPVRRYILHPSRNSFFLGGRVMTGGDSPWAFILTVMIVCGISAVWFACVGKWWWVEGGLGLRGTGEVMRVVHGKELFLENAAARRAGKAIVILCVYAAGLVLSTMAVTAFTDPGILPRNLDPDPPYPTSSPSDGGPTAPMPRDLKVRADTVRVKYCPTCRTYRPPRSSHCKMCDNCVDACDHHCQWVNNCVGRRNYTSFFVLLMTATLTLILILVTAALQLYYLTRWQDLSFGGALRRTPGTAFVFCLSIVVIWPVGALLSYHMRLLLLNVTTIEQIRNQAHKTLVPGPAPPNPFSHGNWRRNFCAVLCRPELPSWLDAHAIATEDRRELNPGLTSHVAHHDAMGDRELEEEIRRKPSARSALNMIGGGQKDGGGGGGGGGRGGGAGGEWDGAMITFRTSEKREDRDSEDDERY